MKKILIVGSSGMIGKLVLKYCLERDDVQQVTVINRRSLGISHPKLKEMLHTDFMNYANITEAFRNIDIAFYCLGVYTGKATKEEFRKITFDYTRVFADALYANSSNASFAFLSGAGADTTEKSSMMFARDKGAAENYLGSKGFSHVYIFRPGYIYPAERRTEPNAMYRLMRILYKPVSMIYPGVGITSVELAGVMVKVAFENGVDSVLENSEMRKILSS